MIFFRRPLAISKVAEFLDVSHCHFWSSPSQETAEGLRKAAFSLRRQQAVGQGLHTLPPGPRRRAVGERPALRLVCTFQATSEQLVPHVHHSNAQQWLVDMAHITTAFRVGI